MKVKYRFFLLFAISVIIAFSFNNKKPTFYLIGDSTVRNPNRPMCGWGELIANYFDSDKINVMNNAMAGRSTRTFIKEGRWDSVISKIQKGDYLIMQFGHNEGSKPDTSKAGYRGVLPGIGEETKELIWPDGKPETVHTYGFYLRKFVREAKAKGATVLIASMIPRNEWRDGKVIRANKDYGKWAEEIAKEEGAFFIPLNDITADKYDALGPDKVKTFFPREHTHTSVEGATINAESVVEGIKEQPTCTLNNYLK